MPDTLARRTNAEIVNLPNVISFARLCAVPVAVWLALRHDLVATFVVFTAAGVSDALDGWVARRRGGSALGAILDPAADKALLVAMFLTLAGTGVLPVWLAVLTVTRDLLIVAGLLVLWMRSVRVRMRPLPISKLNTALQLLLVGATLLLRGFGLPGDALLQALIWIVAATTLLSAAAYIQKALK
jgi:cardiolipin synthase